MRPPAVLQRYECNIRGTRTPRLSEFVAVDIGLARLEPEAEIEAVGRLAFRVRGEVHRWGTEGPCALQSRLHQSLSEATAARRLVDDDILDAAAQSRRDAKNSECECAANQARIVARQQQLRGRGDDLGQGLVRGRGRARRANASRSSASTEFASTISIAAPPLLVARDSKEVARDGIEPPTRGFSVRCSTN
jgi:hypothetical protein